MPIDFEVFPQEVSRALRDLDLHYELLESNDRGANGFLIFGRNRVSNADVAIKFYFGEPGVHQHNEPRLLQLVRSPNVLTIFEARQVDGGWAYFVTPRCFGGDLDDLIQTNPSAYTAIDVALGICSGVSALHVPRMVHRDIKPGNIVIEKGIPRIADFGSVRAFGPGEIEVNASRHSVLYRPPESFDTGRYSTRGDVYQIGLVVYQLLGGALSYNAIDYFNAANHREYKALPSDFERSRYEDEVIRRRAQSATLATIQSLPDWIDNPGRRMIRRLLTPNPEIRPDNVSDIAAELTLLRSRIANWQWAGNIATLTDGKTRVELRPIKGSIYEAYRDNGSGFRKIPRIDPGSIRDLIEQMF